MVKETIVSNELSSEIVAPYPNVKLCDSDIYAQVCESLQIRLQVLRNLADDEVALEANTIDEIVCLQRLDYIEERI